MDKNKIGLTGTFLQYHHDKKLLRSGLAKLGITEFSYTYADLQTLEKVFFERYSNTELGNRLIQARIFGPIVFFYGYVFCEIFRHNFPQAEYINLDSHNLMDLGLGWKSKDVGKMKCFPVSRFRNWLDDPDDSPSALYYGLELMTKYTQEELLHMGTPVGDNWYKFDNGLIFRIHRRELSKEERSRLSKDRLTGGFKDTDQVATLDENGKLIYVNKT